MIGEVFKRAAGIDMQHIPYKGAAAAATDVAGRKVPVSIKSGPSSSEREPVQRLESGK